MKSFKYILTIFFVIPILALLSTQVSASAEVTLTDDKDTNIATVTITHKDETLSAADMEIVFSDNINILNLDPGDLECSMSNSVVENGNKIEILCLSEEDLAETGTIAEISYEVSDGGDYYFYVDQSTLDLGSIVIEKVTDINKPVSVKDTGDQLNEGTQEDTSVSPILNFLKEYYVYIIAGVFILALIIIVLTSTKKDVPPAEVATPTETPTSTPTPTTV